MSRPSRSSIIGKTDLLEFVLNAIEDVHNAVFVFGLMLINRGVAAAGLSFHISVRILARGPVVVAYPENKVDELCHRWARVFLV